MKKQELRKKEFGFKYNKGLDEFFKQSKNKRPMGNARVQFLKDGHRIGKLYWDEIRYVYDFKIKPFIEIKTQNKIKLIIYQNEFELIPDEQMEDTCYLNHLIPKFNTIEFYGEFKWIIKLEELRKF